MPGVVLPRSPPACEISGAGGRAREAVTRPRRGLFNCDRSLSGDVRFISIAARFIHGVICVKFEQIATGRGAALFWRRRRRWLGARLLSFVARRNSFDVLLSSGGGAQTPAVRLCTGIIDAAIALFDFIRQPVEHRCCVMKNTRVSWRDQFIIKPSAGGRFVFGA